MDPQFRLWLAARSWAHGVRYCKVVALLLPPAALAANAPYVLGTAHTPVFAWLVAWQIAVELVCVSVVVADRWWPAVRQREWPLNSLAIVMMLLSTWIGVVDSWRLGDLSVYVAGCTFVAGVLCTTRPVRRPLYVFSLLVLGVAQVWHVESAAALAGLLVNPFCVVVLCAELDVLTLERLKELYAETQRAQAERERADQVLYNTMPMQVADALKGGGRVQATKYDNLGVLFADLAGFTPFARRLPPDALVLMLNDIFSAFDEQVEILGLEKIKTIGDAYMVVSYRRVQPLAELALCMNQALRRYNEANGTELSLRMGLHVGPAVAGVIGVKRPLYDVWGETVNLASRLEASGQPGAIHVSEAVYRQAQADFCFEPRGAVDLKGMGLMPTYWLQGPVAVNDPDASPHTLAA